MSDWLCVKCLHEFPDDATIQRQPEYVGMAIFILIGIAALIFGVLVIFFHHDDALKGILVAAGGLGAIAFGWQLKTGLKAICPACGKPQGIRGNTKSADEIRRKGKKS